MTYPPEECTYEVRWKLGKRGQGVESFPDEYALGEWFKEMTTLGSWEPDEFEMPDEDGRNGYQIYCVSDGQRVLISYRHPRLVMARIDGHRRASTASSNGTH